MVMKSKQTRNQQSETLTAHRYHNVLHDTKKQAGRIKQRLMHSNGGWEKFQMNDKTIRL